MFVPLIPLRSLDDRAVHAILLCLSNLAAATPEAKPCLARVPVAGSLV